VGTSSKGVVGARSLLNVALRLGLAAMTAAVFRAGPKDRRFVDKGIESRIVTVGAPATLLIPALWLRRRHGRYPVWMDDLYLSMYALDLAGNVFDLYDRSAHFDLIPHAHGAGTVTVLAAWLFRLPMPAAIVVATVGHALLEAQEYASDVVWLRNVRAGDTAGDLLAGRWGRSSTRLPTSALYRDAGGSRSPCWSRLPPSFLDIVTSDPVIGAVAREAELMSPAPNSTSLPGPRRPG
jgi:hypothetical protein